MPSSNGTRPLPGHTRVVIVGAGFSGVAAAVRLLQSGRRDFVLIERGDAVGGTWRDNSYPGCACDVPSHLYSLSFAPNPDWTRSFSPQPEIQAYLRRTADELGVLPHLWTGTELLRAAWDDTSQRWTLRTSAGDLTADVFVNACGALSQPSVPDLPGLADFAGTTFHSAHWRHDHDLAGRRVAVIGTGASAIQFVPHVAAQAAHVTVLQRTAPWVLPRMDRGITKAERALYRRVPAARLAVRGAIWSVRESWVLGFRNPKVMARVERLAKAHLRSQIPDPALRAKVTPTFRFGCKRVLLSSDYYPALTRPNVNLVTDSIVEIRPHGVVTAAPDGSLTEHPVETIVFGTGFRVTDSPMAERIVGADGRTMAQRWAAGGMSALRGSTVPGFPNYLQLVGPNTGTGHTSQVVMAEAQVRYLMSALDAMDSRDLAVLEPLPEAERAYTARVHRALEGTVWLAGGCHSWYLDEHGRNTTLWPSFSFAFRRATRAIDLSEYAVTRREAPEVPEPVAMVAR